MKSPRVRPRSSSPDIFATPKRTKLEHESTPPRDITTNEKRRENHKAKGKGKAKEEPIEIDLTHDYNEEVEHQEHLEDSAKVEQEEGPNCSICLQTFEDRTVLPTCSHEFCFECILVWTDQSRRCPLCNQSIGDYLIHSIRSRYDYRKHYLPPLRGQSPPLLPSFASGSNLALQGIRRRRRQERQRQWGRRERERDKWEEQDRLERAIEKRRWVYRYGLYAKHVASNAYTKYRPYPTPSQFAASQELVSRTTTFLRRELQVWEGLDVEFLTTFTLSIMKSLDIRSEGAVKLLSEFLDMDDEAGERRNAQHFAHEVYTYVRSPYRDLFVYDTVVQYDEPPGIPLPPDQQHTRRWRDNDAGRRFTVRDLSDHEDAPKSPSGTRGGDRTNREARDQSRSNSTQESWSPSGRRYPDAREREMMVQDAGSPPPAFRRKKTTRRDEWGMDIERDEAQSDRNHVGSSKAKDERSGLTHVDAAQRGKNPKSERRGRRSTSCSPTPPPNTRTSGKGKGKAVDHRSPRRHRRRSTLRDGEDDIDRRRFNTDRSNHRHSRSRERVLDGNSSPPRDFTPKNQNHKRKRSRSRGEQNRESHGSQAGTSRGAGNINDTDSRWRGRMTRGVDNSVAHARGHGESRGNDTSGHGRGRGGLTSVREDNHDIHAQAGDGISVNVDEEDHRPRKSRTPNQDRVYVHEDHALYSDSRSRASNVDFDADTVSGELKYVGSHPREKTARRGDDGRYSMQVEDEEKGKYSPRAGSSFVFETMKEIGRPSITSPSGEVFRHSDKSSLSPSRSDVDSRRNGLGDSQFAGQLRKAKEATEKTIGQGTIDGRGSFVPTDRKVTGVPRHGRPSGMFTKYARGGSIESIHDSDSKTLIDGIRTSSKAQIDVPADGRIPIMNHNGPISGIRILEMGRGRDTPTRSISVSASRRPQSTGPDEGTSCTLANASSEKGVLSGEHISSTSELEPPASFGHVSRPPRNRTLRDSIQAHLLASTSLSSVRSVPLLSRNISAEKGKFPDDVGGARASLLSSHPLPRAKNRADIRVEYSHFVAPHAHIDNIPSGGAPPLLVRLSDPKPAPPGSGSPTVLVNNANAYPSTSFASATTEGGYLSQAIDGGRSTSPVGSNIKPGIHITRMYSEVGSLQNPSAVQFQKPESGTVNGVVHRRTEASWDNNQVNAQSRLTAPRNVEERASRTRNGDTRTSRSGELSPVDSNIPNARNAHSAAAVALVCDGDKKGCVAGGRVSLLSNGHQDTYDKLSIGRKLPSPYTSTDEEMLNTDGIDGSKSRDTEAICPLNFTAHLSAITHDCAASAHVEDISVVSGEPQERGVGCPPSVSLLSSPGASKDSIPREPVISSRSVYHVGSPPQSSMIDFPMQQETPSKSVIATNSTPHKTTSTSQLDVRMRLFERLQKEKAKADCHHGHVSAMDEDAVNQSHPTTLHVDGSNELDIAPQATSVLDRISSRIDNTRRRSTSLDTPGMDEGLDTSSNGIAETDANALEARLRTRAQLQVRLAAEKRAGGIVSRSGRT